MRRVTSMIRSSVMVCAVSALLAAGCAGQQGPQGPQGPPGERGVDGTNGQNGTSGATGATGSTGATGTVGTSGATGATGATGSTGATGDAGLNGRDFRYSGPGVVVTVLDAGVTDAGVASADLRLADSLGRPLDLAGILTEGAVSVSFVLASLEERSDGFPLQYQTYTRRTVAFDGGSVVQNGTDTGGTWTELTPLGTGQYRYTFGTAVAVGANANKTHTLGLYATRTVQGVRYVDNRLFHFRPDGLAATAQRDIVTTAGCNTCHTRLEAHGGARREVGLCVLCHNNTNSVDPDTGNSFDFVTMVHRLHRGAGLPSVDAGTPYFFVGFNGAVSDFSQVQFPTNISDCEVCHTGSQGSRWVNNPSAKNCTGCHDRTYFQNPSTLPPGFVMHTFGERQDTQCIVCHQTGSVAPIDSVHKVPARDPARVSVAANILSVPRVSPGSAAQVTFSVTVNGQPRDVLAQRLSRLRFVTGGPNAEVARYWSESAETVADCTAVTDGGACLERGADAGVFTYHARTALLATDRGSFTVGIEACHTTDAGVRWCATNPVKEFAVTDTNATPRRTAVTLTQCNGCHRTLAAHGGTRNNTQHCVICHNANTMLGVTVPIDGGTVTAEAANFKNLIHEIHGQARYPSPKNACAKCHVAGAWNVPLPAASLPSRSELRSCGALPDGGSGAPADGGLSCEAAAVTATAVFQGPVSSACISCHGSAAAQAHAALNTTSQGAEACAVCHANGRSEGVDVVHAVAP